MKKVAKKQRKRLSIPNAMVNRSFRDGERIKLGGVIYHGRQQETAYLSKINCLPLVRVW